MGARIAIVGTGAVGGYAGAHMAQAGEDVTFVDFWPENVEVMRTKGLKISHLKDVPEFTVPVKALHITELQGVTKTAPFDIAFVCIKSYDTEWATTMVRQYLSPNGYVVSLQNCMNEETIAKVVGWGRVARLHRVLDHGRPVRAGPRPPRLRQEGPDHTVFRVGEVHGRITERAKEVTRLVAYSDGALTTDNLWGERWSKLVANVMGNGMSACTGLVSRDMILDDSLRAFGARLGSEAIRVGQALGYDLEEIHHMDAEVIAKAGEGDAKARAEYDEHRIAEVKKAGGGEHRPSMGQDMVKGRRTEIEFLNGFVCDKAKDVGIDTPANAALTDIVKRVEKGELKPDKKHILDLRMN